MYKCKCKITVNCAIGKKTLTLILTLNRMEFTLKRGMFELNKNDLIKLAYRGWVSK